MYSRLKREYVKMYYEIIFDEKTISFNFALHPEANNTLFQILTAENPTTKWLRTQSDFSPFTFPDEICWGFGNLIKKNEKIIIEDGWTAWECMIPKKPTNANLKDVVGNIYQLAGALLYFGFENKDSGSKDKKQFMTLDDFLVNSDRLFHSGAFSFSYARPVLDFCAKFLANKNGNMHKKLIETMQKAHLYLTGENKLKKFDEYSFCTSICQGDSRLISLKCPGNCA